VERLNDVLEVNPEMSDGPADGRVELPVLRGHVRLDQVTFRYEEDGKNVLQSVSLEVLPGQRVGLVGRSGSGKSTLIKLLLGFYAPSSGAVEIDGFPMSDVWLPSLRKQIGIVPQDVFLFHGTVRENLSQTNPAASLAQVVEAARQAGAHDFIAALPNGYETMLDPSGSNVSGGQRQRLAIARALLQHPRLIILDEATSALDNEAERHFLHNLDALFHDRTVFMIAHRLATVRNADLIVVLDRGTIVEQGTHDELMARRGLYYFLSTQQLNL
jgi:ATP-binding cassette subfamily B protein